MRTSARSCPANPAAIAMTFAGRAKPPPAAPPVAAPKNLLVIMGSTDWATPGLHVLMGCPVKTAAAATSAAGGDENANLLTGNWCHAGAHGLVAFVGCRNFRAKAIRK